MRSLKIYDGKSGGNWLDASPCKLGITFRTKTKPEKWQIKNKHYRFDLMTYSRTLYFGSCSWNSEKFITLTRKLCLASLRILKLNFSIAFFNERFQLTASMIAKINSLRTTKYYDRVLLVRSCDLIWWKSKKETRDLLFYTFWGLTECGGRHKKMNPNSLIRYRFQSFYMFYKKFWKKINTKKEERGETFSARERMQE